MRTLARSTYFHWIRLIHWLGGKARQPGMETLDVFEDSLGICQSLKLQSHVTTI